VHDNALDELWMPHREDGRRRPAARDAEEAQRPRREHIDDRLQQRHLVVERQGLGTPLPVRQPGSEAVVPHDLIATSERLDELSEAGVPPVLDEVTDPP
jgi:hypothetical protein